MHYCSLSANNMYTLLLLLLTVVGTNTLFVPSWKIVGGSVAEDGQFPHQISLKSKNFHICGGSIIKPKFILSAAHCVDAVTSKDLTVVAGTNKESVTEPFYQVSTYYAHEDYDLWTVQNDIAVLRLSKELTYDSKVQPIDLGTDFVGVGVQCTLSGWGSLQYPGPSPEDLQYIHLLTIANDVCGERLSDKPIRDGQICTFTVKGEGSCQGDSGGPLISDNKQIGIVSWGRPCARGYPDVFTRVSAYIDWISIYSK